MGLDLIVPIEMVDYGYKCAASGAYCVYISLTSLNPSDYDGATYYFEVVAINNDTVERDIKLQIGAAVKATVTIPANTNVATRIRTGSFTPSAGNNSYLLKPEGTASNDQLQIFVARIIVIQTNATKTRIQIPLTGRQGLLKWYNHKPWTDGARTSYGQGNARWYSIYRKNAAQFADVSAWKFECVLKGVVGLDQTSFASLFNKTDNTQVMSSEVSSDSNDGDICSADITDDPNFHDLDEFEVRTKSNESDYNIVYFCNAHLYVYLTDLSKAEIYQRVATNYTLTTGAHTFEEDRAKVDIDSYTGPTCYFEATGYCADNAERFDLQDDGTDDSGTAGTSKVTNSGINFNSGTKARKRTTSAMILTDGNRYWGNKVGSSSSGYWTNALIVIQVISPDITVYPTTLELLSTILAPVVITNVVLAETLELSSSLLSPSVVIDFLIVPATLELISNVLSPSIVIDFLIIPETLELVTGVLSPDILFDWVEVVAILELISDILSPTINFDWTVEPGILELSSNLLSPVINFDWIEGVATLELSAAILSPTINFDWTQGVTTLELISNVLSPIILLDMVVYPDPLVLSVELLSPKAYEVLFEKIKLNSIIHTKLELDSIIH